MTFFYKNITSKAALLCLSSLSLTGCLSMDLYEPTNIKESVIEVREQEFSEDVMLHDVDEGYLKALAHHYSRYGGSTMDLVVTYDPRSYRNTAMYAAERASDIAGTLRINGVKDIKSGVMPIKAAGDHARLLVTYTSMTAHAPKGCDTLLPGTSGSVSAEPDRDYALGCTLDTMLARQVSKPSDLLGRGTQDSATDGRATSNVIEGYRTGVMNESLEGERASGE